MLTAILPVRINQNAFWSSSKGLECIENFLITCKRVSDIDKFIVITRDLPICRLAEKHGMEITDIDIPGTLNRPYVFEQSRSLAIQAQEFLINQNDTLIIADHRNLFLSTNDIADALGAYQKNSAPGVISVVFCRDYPCQCRSYFKFLDCIIMNFNDLGTRDQASDIPSSSRNMEITCHTNEGKDIAITLSINGSRCYISFHAQTQLKEGFVAQILPIYQNGPQYEQSREIFVLTLEHKIPLDIDVDHLSGIILILTVPAYSGEYDTVEIFTPPNAPWELCGSGPTVFRKETQEPINGRQNFPPTFTYDGSLFIVGAEYSLEKPNSEPTPFILRNSCIATDWVDYWYTVATQIQ